MVKTLSENKKKATLIFVTILVAATIIILALLGIFENGIYRHVLVSSNKIMYKIAFWMGMAALIAICPLPFLKNKWIIIIILVVGLLLAISSMALNIEGVKFNFH